MFFDINVSFKCFLSSGTCYQKVREEQERMVAAMPEHDRLFNAPRKEVVFVYQGEGKTKDNAGDTKRPKYKGKYIVELDRPRPEWWAKDLLPKVRGGGQE